MGNTVFGGFRLLGNEDFSNHTQLGESVTIDLKRTKKERKTDDGKNETREEWEVTYTVEGYTCKLRLSKLILGHDSDGGTLLIRIQDNNMSALKTLRYDGCDQLFLDDIRKAEAAGLLDADHCTQNRRYISGNTIYGNSEPYTRKISRNAWGGVTETNLLVYGEPGKKMGLSVREWKKKGQNEKPFLVTLAHYYVNTMVSNGPGIGLSVVLKIRVSNDGQLDFDVDGPVQHPTDALFYMFKQVNETKIWKPTACPHCATTRRQPPLTFMHSESEDSDGHPLGSQPNARRYLSHIGGVYKGNGNGNFYERNKIYFGT